MKLRPPTLLLPAIIILGIASSAFAQILNPGFETWSGGDPVNWHTNNVLPVLVTVKETTDVHSGSAAAWGEVVNFSTFAIPANLLAGADGRGCAVSSRQPALHGWYKFSPVGGDQFWVSVNMTKGGSLVGSGSFMSPDSQGVFKEFVADITYITPDVPDTCVIAMTIINGSGTENAGSSFIVDDLAFGAVTSVDTRSTPLPERFALLQNYPNPFNPVTNISYTIPRAEKVTLKVYDLLGREVAVLVDRELGAGVYSAQLDAANLESGTYFCRLQAGTFTGVRKLMLLK